MTKAVPSRWRETILVCGKCSRRADGGFGRKGRTSLAKLLREAGLAGKGRKAERGVVETGCLKLCPKDAVVAINSARPDRWLVLRTQTGLPEIVQQLGIVPPPA